MDNGQGFEIDFLAVGNKSKGGDAIAIRFGKINQESPEQKVIVIDGGYKETGEELKKLIKDRYKTKTIDLVILTHPDKDHASGLRVLFEDDELIIKKLVMHRPWLNDKINTSYFKDKRKTEKSLNNHLKEAFNFAYDLAELAASKIGESNISEPRVGSRYLDDVITILGPNTDLYRKSIINSDKTPEQIGYIEKQRIFSGSQDYEYKKFNIGDEIEWYHDETTSPINETSVITFFDFLGNKMLLTGDAGKEGLQNAFDYAKEKKISLSDLKVFQVPHHGSRKNISPELLDKFSSSFYIISVPPEGDPKHPSRRLINLMSQKNLNVYTTARRSVHWGENYPSGNWSPIEKMNYFSTIETK